MQRPGRQTLASPFQHFKCLSQTCRQLRQECGPLARDRGTFWVPWQDMPDFVKILYPDIGSHHPHPPMKLTILLDPDTAMPQGRVDILPILRLVADNPRLKCKVIPDPDSEWRLDNRRPSIGGIYGTYTSKNRAVGTCNHISKFIKPIFDDRYLWWNDIRRGAVEKVEIIPCRSWEEMNGKSQVSVHFRKGMAPQSVVNDSKDKLYAKEIGLGRSRMCEVTFHC